MPVYLSVKLGMHSRTTIKIPELINIEQPRGVAESYLVRVGECYGYTVGYIL